MKMSFVYPGRLMVAMGAVACIAISNVWAGDPASAEASQTPAPVVTAAPSTGAPAPATRLPYGCEDIVKLSRAQISEDIILNYVRNSGTIYNLGPAEIVALKQQGVPDKVINAMVDKSGQPSVVAAQPAPQAQPAPVPAPSQVPPPTDPNAVVTAPNVPTVDAQPAPSTVYVMPYAPAAPYYYYYGPSYYPYYYGPSVSFGFRFGGGWRGGWHGGWGHGGFHHR